MHPSIHSTIHLPISIHPSIHLSVQYQPALQTRHGRNAGEQVVSKTDLVHPILKVMSAEKTDTYRKTVGDVALWGPVGNKEGKPRQPSAKSTSSDLTWLS